MATVTQEIVRVEKRLLRFLSTSDDDAQQFSSRDELRVTNVTPDDVAFKVKTTNQQRYVVRPNVGVIPAGHDVAIDIVLQGASPPAGPSKDKFLLRVVPAPGLEDDVSPADLWHALEDDPSVVGLKFKVEFYAPAPAAPAPASQRPYAAPPLSPLPSPPPSPPPRAPPAPPPGNVVNAAAVVEDVVTPAPRVSPPTRPPPERVDMGDPAELLREDNYERAMASVRELQDTLDRKNLELARLKMELAETRAETERVLKEAPKTPLSANKVVSDPFGGVSVAGLGLMLVLFLILVNVILRIV